ncbi:DNA-binding transcriptional regulator YhcF (GntR family) [Kibdelosporangium banguiense]|uniref:DNA-binding transcriptional regulator YhcF (GntR family) n=1 Tax=Kibdelosporangium banguiense TaxID=1365924 RepID=A0ABS4TTT6_9PSEU|nr:GntR family transcriptional regulator [Kibdelosporangium banguiense]MBP2327380.1 DNA-binding transcriptional regulator YhcF (GntR family) [Kibdelosporangium banguiense]
MISIDPESSVAPFEQVRSQFAQQITDRTLPVGAKLPTVRALAAELGLAANTVAKAYRELEEAGLIETRGRAGTFVSAAGQHAQIVVQRAAAEYALKARSLGMNSEEALSIVRAAIEANARS